MRGFTYEASFGGVRIDVLSTDITHGRTVPRHSYPARDGADLEDMGRNPLECSLSIIFVDNSRDESDYQARFDAFNAMVDSGEVRTLVHPYLGEIRGRIEAFSHQSDGDSDAIRASFTFVEEISQRPVLSAGAGAPVRASSHEVSSASASANQALSDAGLSSDLPGEIATEVRRWESDPELSAREIQLQMGSLNDQLNAELDSFDALGDLALFPILRAYTQLQSQLRRAAEAFTATSTRIVELTVTEPLPLRIVAARFYGADAAADRFEEMLTLNPSLRDVTLVPSGITLKAFSPATPKPAANA